MAFGMEDVLGSAKQNFFFFPGNFVALVAGRTSVRAPKRTTLELDLPMFVRTSCFLTSPYKILNKILSPPAYKKKRKVRPSTVLLNIRLVWRALHANTFILDETKKDLVTRIALHGDVRNPKHIEGGSRL